MGKSGQNNFKGVNSQAWAALSLFLQFLRDPRFSHIHLEAEGFEDFNLVFDDGRKIICESKDRKKPFNYADLKDILKKISRREIGKRDEILIICSNVNKKLVSDVEHAKYWDPIKELFIKKGYTKKMVGLLPQVKFWHVKTPLSQKDVVYVLFSDLLNFWLPEEENKRIVDSLLVQKIYAASASGTTYSKIDILKEANSLAVEGRKNSVYYNEELSKREGQFDELQEALKNSSHPTWKVPKELSAFSTDFERLKFAKDRLSRVQDQLVLKNWDPIWKLNRLYVFNFGIFDIFSKNLQTKENRKYVVDYIKKYTKSIRGFYRSDYFVIDVVKILGKILESEDGVEYLEDSFQIIKDLLTFKEKEFLFLRNKDDGHDQWQVQQVCGLLLKIYLNSGTQDKLKRKIFELVSSVFDIARNDGEYDWYAPKEVYQLLYIWLNEDFLGRFEEIVKVIVRQYEEEYKKFEIRNGFDGWEYAGGSTSFAAGDYYVGDRHFIGSILEPAIENFYKKDPKTGWNFIRSRCITEAKDVSKKRPDFLNRSVYKIVLSRYEIGDQEVSQEAFSVLKTFLLSNRGIPHKTDLIYQNILGSLLSAEKKWALVSLTAQKYDLPINPFEERIISMLVEVGVSEAKDVLEKWYGNQAYYERFMSDHSTIESIQKMLDVDFDFALKLFMKFLSSNKVRGDGDKRSQFSSYNVAELLHLILEKNYEKGLSILRFLDQQESLSVNEQIIYAFSLFNYKGNDDSDNAQSLLKIFDDVIRPLLFKYKNNTRFVKRFSNSQSRDAFVQFSCRLAVKREIEKSLYIVEFFVDDPDPYLPNKDPEDKKNEYNEHGRIVSGEKPHSITSVRGWCGWVLMKCSVLQGRNSIAQIIKLTKKLVEDENYYVVHMGCFALSQLARNRLTVLPDNPKVAFLNDDKVLALKEAKKIEKIAFNLLKRSRNWPVLVQNAMGESILHAFDPIRSLNEKDAWIFVNLLAGMPDEVMSEAAPFFIFYAEFRKNAFVKWNLKSKGLYDDLGPEKYDQAKFRKILKETIERLQKTNSDSVFKFAAQFEHAMREPVGEDKNRYIELALEYFDLMTNAYAHNIFNLIYRVIEGKLQTPDAYMDKWFALLVKCLKIEKIFYFEQELKGKLSEVYWYPSLYHSHILELVYEKRKLEDFKQVLKLFFSFPEKMELHESAALVSFIQKLAQDGDIESTAVIELLKKKDPTKYWELGKETK